MDIYLDERSSLQFVRAWRLTVADPYISVASRLVEPLPWISEPRGAIKPMYTSALAIHELMKRTAPETAHSLAGCLPLSLLVGSDAARPRPSAYIERVHVVGTELPAGAMLQVAPGIHVCSPAYALVRLVRKAAPGAWLMHVMELCGSYAIDPACREGIRRVRPVTCADDIRTRLAAHTELRGARAARRLAAFAFDGAASPPEARLALLLSLPLNYGGYGYPQPVLNVPLTLPQEGPAAGGPASPSPGSARTRSFIPDLFWPDARLVLEYDSDLEHADGSRIARDARRRNELEARGYTVLTATRGQLRGAVACDELAEQVARYLGVSGSPRDLSDAWRVKNRALRHDLGIAG